MLKTIVALLLLLSSTAYAQIMGVGGGDIFYSAPTGPYASADFCDNGLYNGSSYTSIACTTGIVTAGDVLVIASAISIGTAFTTFTDSVGGTITQFSGFPIIWNNGSAYWHIACLPNAAAGAHTITLSGGSGPYVGLVVMGFHGENTTNPCAVTTATTVQDTPSTNLSAGPVTTTIANSIVIGLSANNTGPNTYTADSGFTLVASPNAGFGLEYAIEASTGSYTPAFTLSSSAKWVETALVVHP